MTGGRGLPLPAAVLLLLLSPPVRGDELPGILDVWDFADPSGSQVRFEELAARADSVGNVIYAAEVRTQIARCQGLRGEFDAALQTLDRIQALPAAETPRVRVRFLLERGRVLNSSGSPREAEPQFEAAWEAARVAEEDYLAADAAHMAAIVAVATEDAIRWTQMGMERAVDSRDPRARHWLGPLHNNLGWRFYQDGRYPDALREFEKSRAAYRDEGDDVAALIARYATGKTLRAQGRVEEAVRVQEEVAEAFRAWGDEDGYVLEELALGYLALGNTEKGRECARRAYELLSRDPWFAENEADRLARLRTLGQETETGNEGPR